MFRFCLLTFIHFIYIDSVSPLESQSQSLSFPNSAKFQHRHHQASMLPFQSHVPYAPSRLNPSFPVPTPLTSLQVPSPLTSINAPAPQPFPSPPNIVGGGRFGKRKLSVIKGEGRGTMSMPTSPLRQSINTEVWQGVSSIPYIE
jgi:hypothetical protein